MRPPAPRPLVLVGHPGTGKTSVALQVAARLSQRGEFVEILHTDRLKVSARTLAGAPQGAAWNHDADVLAPTYRPLLDAHIDDASAKGLRLIIEGTLAAFTLRPAHRMQLVCAPETRLLRADAKPAPARDAIAALRDGERQRLTSWFAAVQPVLVDASPAIGDVAADVEARLRAAERPQ